MATTQRPGAGRQKQGGIQEMDVLLCRVMGNMLTYHKGLVVAPSKPLPMLFYVGSNRSKCDRSVIKSKGQGSLRSSTAPGL